MTKEEAIEVLKAYRDRLTNSASNQLDGDIKAFEMAISAMLESVTTSMEQALLLEVIDKLLPIECEDVISREWLKTAIHNFYYGLKHTPTEEDIQAYINAAPSVNQQPCTDAVSREAVLDAIKRISLGQTDAVKVSMMTEDYVKKLPSVTQKSGKWIERKNVTCLDNVMWKYECSKCGYEVRSKYHYCPNCGEKMQNEINVVLDKIRTEIEKVVWDDIIVSLDGTDEIRIPRLDPDDVFEIIDKYKAERR